MKNEDQSFYAERAKWLDHLVERQDVTHGEFRVAYFIASKINPVDRCMWWSVDAISEEIGMSRATVSAATSRLNEKGLLIVSKGHKGARIYSKRMPVDPSGDLFKSIREKRRKTGGRIARISKNETG